jgi:hypothetical protein
MHTQQRQKKDVCVQGVLPASTSSCVAKYPLLITTRVLASMWLTVHHW